MKHAHAPGAQIFSSLSDHPNTRVGAHARGAHTRTRTRSSQQGLLRYDAAPQAPPSSEPQRVIGLAAEASDLRLVGPKVVVPETEGPATYRALPDQRTVSSDDNSLVPKPDLALIAITYQRWNDRSGQSRHQASDCNHHGWVHGKNFSH
jgi:hypothetical protein